MDSAGNAYVTGAVFGDGSVPVTGGIEPNPPTTSPFSSRAFVAKLNSTGTALVYCTYLSGSGFDEGTGIAVDSAGNTYVGGWTNSTNFPITSGAFQTTIVGGTSGYGGFVTKINSSGTALIYSTYLGGTANSTLKGIAVDPSGNAYVTGYTSALDFPTTQGAFQTVNKSIGVNIDTCFISKLNPSGTGLVYSTYIGGSTEDQASAIALDAAGDAYITGATMSTDFPTTPGAYQLVNKAANALGPNWTAFVTKMDPTGTKLIYSTYLGGSFLDLGLAIAVDSSGSAYVTGQANSRDFPTTTGVFQTTLPSYQSNPNQSAFVTKLNPSGTGLAYSTFLGGTFNVDPPQNMG